MHEFKPELGSDIREVCKGLIALSNATDRPCWCEFNGFKLIATPYETTLQQLLDLYHDVSSATATSPTTQNPNQQNLNTSPTQLTMPHQFASLFELAIGASAGLLLVRHPTDDEPRIEIRTHAGLFHIAYANRSRQKIWFLLQHEDKGVWRKLEARCTKDWRNGSENLLEFKVTAEGPYTPNIMPPPKGSTTP